jgi:hypothetical protein
MARFEDKCPTLENYWRAIILFGRNVASYKFALGKSLLELALEEKTRVSLTELSEPFSRNLLNHLRIAPKQGTSPSSRFLKACKNRIEGTVGQDELIETTSRLGFVNVIDAFHVVGPGEIPVRFFTDERKSEINGICLTDELLELAQHIQRENLEHEVEARWRLVETAWALNLNRQLITVDHDPKAESIFAIDRRRRRVSVTSSRDALNGYQKGKCFYCFADISVVTGSASLADVDHFFPHLLKVEGLVPSVDGIWNLVLACASCNRGVAGKSAMVPSIRLLQRLHTRNEYLIQSHHPLRETLMRQTGTNHAARGDFLQQVFSIARTHLVHTWEPKEEHEPAF